MANVLDYRWRQPASKHEVDPISRIEGHLGVKVSSQRAA